MAPSHRVRVKVVCSQDHEHEVCVRVGREVHPALRCSTQQGDGYGYGGGGVCTLPPNLRDLVDRELRDNYQESRRRGWVLIAA